MRSNPPEQTGVLRSFGHGLLLTAFLSLSAFVAIIWHLDSWGITPERAAQQDGYCEDAPLLKAHQQTPTTAVVVCRGLPGSLKAGHVVVSRLPWGLWWASPSGANSTFAAAGLPHSELIDYSHHGVTQSIHTTLILWGQVRSAEVVALEATLNNGQTLRDEVKNGLFLFDAPIRSIGVKVDELTVLGSNDRLLQRIKIP